MMDKDKDTLRALLIVLYGDAILPEMDAIIKDLVISVAMRVYSGESPSAKEYKAFMGKYHPLTD